MGIDIRRNYSITNDDRKNPKERKKENDRLMQEFLAKGGKITKVKAHKPTKDQLKNWKI